MKNMKPLISRSSYNKKENSINILLFVLELTLHNRFKYVLNTISMLNNEIVDEVFMTAGCDQPIKMNAID